MSDWFLASPKKQTTPAKLKKEIGIVPFATPKRGRKPKAATFKNTTSPAKVCINFHRFSFVIGINFQSDYTKENDSKETKKYWEAFSG